MVTGDFQVDDAVLGTRSVVLGTRDVVASQRWLSLERYSCLFVVAFEGLTVPQGVLRPMLFCISVSSAGFPRQEPVQWKSYACEHTACMYYASQGMCGVYHEAPDVPSGAQCGRDITGFLNVEYPF